MTTLLKNGSKCRTSVKGVKFKRSWRDLSKNAISFEFE